MNFSGKRDDLSKDLEVAFVRIQAIKKEVVMNMITGFLYMEYSSSACYLKEIFDKDVDYSSVFD